MSKAQPITFLTIICCALCADLHSQSFSAKTIPAELKENVDAVVREDIIKWNITSSDRSTYSVRTVVTILNPNADHWAFVAVGYDKLRKVSGLKVNVYDENGESIRKVKSSEIKDVSEFEGSTLFSDNRIKYVNAAHSRYPYTVEFEYELDLKFLFNDNGSFILKAPRTSTQHFQLQVTSPPLLMPRHRVLNTKLKPAQTKNSNGTETLTWEVTNVAGLKTEPAGPSFREISPRVMLVPSKFEFSGYAGDMSTWRGLNDWILQLNQGRDAIPEATKKKVESLTKDLQTTEEKAKVLYEYLQSKTRYVSIQLGIGGLQPFEASVVDQVGYGDCKALSNYMVSLLNAAGIKGYYTLIAGGSDQPPLMVDFPYSQFNHVVVAVPDGRDTLWLECTSQTNPFGYQGNFTGNRKALMITETGGKIVNTTYYPAEGNVRLREAVVTLQSTGDASAKVRTVYSGTRYDPTSSVVTQSPEDQKKWLFESIRIPNYNLGQFKISSNKSRTPSSQVDMDLTLSRYASVSGKRLFVMPNLMSRNSYIPENLTTRKSNVVIDRGYVDADSIVYSIPEAIYPEFIPESIKHESRFGSYEARFALEEGRLVYTRRLKVKEGNYPPESYQEYVDFYRNVSKADNVKIVFLNKT